MDIDHREFTRHWPNIGWCMIKAGYFTRRRSPPTMADYMMAESYGLIIDSSPDTGLL